MTDYLSWFYVAGLSIPALTIIFATYKTSRYWQQNLLLTNMVELSAFFTIPLFYAAAAACGIIVGLLSSRFEIGFLVGGGMALIAGQIWLVIRLRPLLTA